jgi:hypothetical protein
MNYQKIYNDLILKAKQENRIKYSGIYYEKHHIIPKCLGGSNIKDNLILLTAREHFVAHKLLLLIHPKNRGLIYAFWRLTHRLIHDKKIGHITSRDYAYIKELFHSIPKNKSPEVKQNMSKARKGKSYYQIYGENSLEMKKKRKEQTAGKGNPLSKKYLIHNNRLNLYWFCHGNLDNFCTEKHVSGRTLQQSRKSDSYINSWKCIPFIEEIHKNIPFIVY